MDEKKNQNNFTASTVRMKIELLLLLTCQMQSCLTLLRARPMIGYKQGKKMEGVLFLFNVTLINLKLNFNVIYQGVTVRLVEYTGLTKQESERRCMFFILTLLYRFVCAGLSIHIH